MEGAIDLITQIAIIIFSVVIHEVSHGYAALWQGDRTAQYAGRLTLNPIPHLDPIGSVILPFFLGLLGAPIIGWAKPVPFNPYNLRQQKWGPALVAIAGPISNITVALIFGILLRALLAGAVSLPEAFYVGALKIFSFVILLNILLALFNLVPIPPLDGSKVLFALMPYQWYEARVFLEQYGFILILLLVFGFGHFLFPLTNFLFRLIVGIGISL